MFLEEIENSGLKTVGGLANGDKRRATIIERWRNNRIKCRYFGCLESCSSNPMT